MELYNYVEYLIQYIFRLYETFVLLLCCLNPVRDYIFIKNSLPIKTKIPLGMRYFFIKQHHSR